MDPSLSIYVSAVYQPVTPLKQPHCIWHCWLVDTAATLRLRSRFQLYITYIYIIILYIYILCRYMMLHVVDGSCGICLFILYLTECACLQLPEKTASLVGCCEALGKCCLQSSRCGCAASRWSLSRHPSFKLKVWHFWTVTCLSTWPMPDFARQRSGARKQRLMIEWALQRTLPASLT